MAHEIEQFTDGTAAFASANTSAWHRLGTVTDGAMTAEEAMAIASLAGWNVRLLPLTATEITADGTTSVEVPQHFATARTHSRRPAARRRSEWSAATITPCRMRSTPSS